MTNNASRLRLIIMVDVMGDEATLLTGRQKLHEYLLMSCPGLSDDVRGTSRNFKRPPRQQLLALSAQLNIKWAPRRWHAADGYGLS